MKNCVDLELAKELKKNGFPQEKPDCCWHLDEGVWDLWYIGEPDKTKNCYSSPTSDELLEELPDMLTIKIFREKNFYYLDTDSEFTPQFYDKKPSNNYAKLWLYLKRKDIWNEFCIRFKR